MRDKQDDYAALLHRIIPEVVARAPGKWSAGTLIMDCNGARVRSHLEYDGHSAVASNSLRALAVELYEKMDRHGDTWSSATVHCRQEGGRVQFDVDFEYENAGHSAPMVKPKPWWRFW